MKGEEGPGGRGGGGAEAQVSPAASLKFMGFKDIIHVNVERLFY